MSLSATVDFVFLVIQKRPRQERFGALSDRLQPVQQIQIKIRTYLQIFLMAESSLLFISFYYQLVIPEDCSAVAHFHTFALCICFVEFLATVFVYLRHYRYKDHTLLDGRFQFRSELKDGYLAWRVRHDTAHYSHWA